MILSFERTVCGDYRIILLFSNKMKPTAFFLRLLWGKGLFVSVFFLLGGCSSVPSTPEKEKTSTELLLAYAEKINRNLQDLRHQEKSSSPGRILISEEVRGPFRNEVQKFQNSLNRYQEFLEENRRKWKTSQVDAIQKALGQSEEIQRELEASALQISLLSDSIQNRQESLKLDRNPGQNSLKETDQYTATCLKLAKLSSSVNEFILTIHSKDLIKSSTEGCPQAVVYHFLRLHHLQHRHIQILARYYEASWNEWIRKEVANFRYDAAMHVFLFVAAATETYRPEAPQGVYEITHSCLKKVPTLDGIQRMEEALEKIDEIYSKNSGGPKDWNAVLKRAKGTLLLCRAKVTSDPTEGLLLARKAFELNPYLSNEFVEYLLLISPQIGSTHIQSGRYVLAVDAVREALSHGPGIETDEIVSRYRSDVFWKAISDSQEDLKRKRFDLVKQRLFQATQIGTTIDERNAFNEILYQYYQEYTNDLLEHDIEKAIAVSEEMLEIFPGDQRARRIYDGCSLVVLKQDLGDLENCLERMGPEVVLEKIKKTSKAMMTANGSSYCHDLFNEIVQTWSRHLEEIDEPEEAFDAGVVLARFQSVDNVKAEGARAIWNLFDGALKTNDWRSIENCIDTYFLKCPEAKRPDSFKQGYLSFLEHLDGNGNVKKLGRHITLFKEAYPRDTAPVMELALKYMKMDDDLGLGFYFLAKSIDPDAKLVKEFEHHSEGGNLDGEKGIHALIDRKELEGSEGWWREPLESEGAGSVAGGGFGISSKQLFCLICMSSSLLIFLGLAAFTLRKRILALPWYAAGALWVGLSIGIIAALFE